MSQVAISLLATLFAAAPLAAQPPLTAKSFLPVDYETTLFADLKLMRDRGIWDELDHSVLSIALRQMEKESGMSMDALDRVRAVIVHPPANQDVEESFDFKTLFLFEGNAPLGLPPTINGNSSYRQDRIGEYDCVLHGDGPHTEVLVRPTVDLRVVGSRELIEPALTGKPPKGLPKPDLMSLLSGRGDNLAYVVVAVSTPTLRRHVQLDLLQTTEWPATDQPTYLMFRLQATGSADDPHLRIEAVLRHQVGKEGLAISEKAMRGWLAAVKASVKVPALKPVWDGIVIEQSGIDLVAHADLGRARTAIGTLAQLIAPIFHTTSVSEERVEVPPPPPPPKNPGKE